MRREEVERRLQSSMAVVRSILLSPTWGRKEDFVGTIRDDRLEMRVRHGYSNGLTRIFYGTIAARGRTTLVEGEFRTLLWVVFILRGAWLAIFASAFLGRQALPVAAVMVLILGAIETIARRLGDRDEERMRDFLTRSL